MFIAAAVVAASAAGGLQARASSASARASGLSPNEIAALLRGVPQRGAWLGRPHAPLVLVEYVDVQCPYCAAFSQHVFPAVVRRYVKTGRVRVLFRGLAFVGPNSVSGLQWVVAAGRQNRLWNVLELLFARQGRENSGWVTEGVLAEVARSAGLEPGLLRRDRGSPAVTAAMRAAALAARGAHVPGTPYFEVGRTLGALQPLPLKSFDPKDFSAQLAKLLVR